MPHCQKRAFNSLWVDSIPKDCDRLILLQKLFI